MSTTMQPDAMFDGIDDNFIIDQPTPPHPEPREGTQTPRKQRGRQRKAPPEPGTTPRPETPKPGKGLIRPRWQRKVFVTGVNLVLILALILGFKAMLFPKAPTPVDDIAAAAARQLGDTGFPTQPAMAFAQRFTTAYFTAGQDPSLTAPLAAYAPALDTTTWVSTAKPAQLLSSPSIANKTSNDAHNAVITTATLLAPANQWAYLAVPIFADDSGNLSVSAPPALVPAPPVAQPQQLDQLPAPDTTQAAALGTLLDGFFDAWAASDNAALDRYLTPDATSTARSGLSAVAKRTNSVFGLALAPSDSSSDQWVSVTVPWASPIGMEWKQAYRVHVITDATGKASIADITSSQPLVGDTNSQPPSSASPTP